MFEILLESLTSGPFLQYPDFSINLETLALNTENVVINAVHSLDSFDEEMKW